MLAHAGEGGFVFLFLEGPGHSSEIRVILEGGIFEDKEGEMGAAFVAGNS